MTEGTVEQLDLKAIKRLMAEARPAPWSVGPYYKSDVESPHGRVAECGVTRGVQAEHDAALIVTLRNQVPALLSALEQTRDSLRVIRGALAKLPPSSMPGDTVWHYLDIADAALASVRE